MKYHYLYRFYLFNEAELGFTAHLLALRSFAGRSGLKTLSGGEFGWGGTSVKPQRRCPKGDSWRTEISVEQRVKVPLILIFSVNTNHESVAYRSFMSLEI